MTETVRPPEQSSPPQPPRWSDRWLMIVDRWRWALFALLAAAYLLAFNGQWQPWPDGALYLSLGRNLALGRGYTYHGSPHGLAYPGLPVALSLAFRLFPQSSSHAIAIANVLILLCGVAALALTYRLCTLAFDRPTAVMVTLGLGVCHEFFRYSFEILTDMPFLAGVMAVLVGVEAIFGERRAKIAEPVPEHSHEKSQTAHWWDWLILLAGLVIAVATRPTMLGLLASLIVSLLWIARRPGRARWISLGGVAAILSCAAAFYLVDPRRSNSQIGGYEQFLLHGLWQNAREKGWANLQDLLTLTAGRSAFGMPMGIAALNVITGLLVLLAGVLLVRQRLLWGVWIIVTLTMLLLVESNDRYILQILPLLVLGWWLLLRQIERWVGDHIGRRVGGALFVAMLCWGMIPNLVQVGGIIGAQRARPFLASFRDGRYVAYEKIARPIARFTTDKDAIYCEPKFGRILTFFSDRRVLEPGEPNNSTGAQFAVIDSANSSTLGDWLQKQNLIPIGPPLAIATAANGSQTLQLRRLIKAPASP